MAARSWYRAFDVRESCWLRIDLMFCLGPSSEMSIFCERSLEWIAQKTEDPSSMIALQRLKIAMSGHFKFSRIDDGRTLFKDLQLWPLPPSHIAQKYIAGNWRNPPFKSPLLTVRSAYFEKMQWYSSRLRQYIPLSIGETDNIKTKGACLSYHVLTLIAL
jgi:hypothetical protein